jgi:hypothetical protein
MYGTVHGALSSGLREAVALWRHGNKTRERGDTGEAGSKRGGDRRAQGVIDGPWFVNGGDMGGDKTRERRLWDMCENPHGRPVVLNHQPDRESVGQEFVF